MVTKIESDNEFTYIKQNRVYAKNGHQRQRLLYNYKGVNSSLRYNNSDYFCKQHWNSQVYK